MGKKARTREETEDEIELYYMEETSEEDFGDIDDWIEDDQISPEEEGFIRGYIQSNQAS